MGTLNSRLEKYFGTIDIDLIKLRLLKPSLDKCMKMGLDMGDALEYLKNQGFEYYTSISNPKIKFNRHVSEIYRNIKLEAKSAYETVRRVYFTQPFLEYLSSIGIDDFLSENIVNIEIVRNDNGQIIGQDYEIVIKEWSIVEHLVARNIPNIEIALALGLCKEGDSKDVRAQAARKIKNYLQGRWTIPVRDSELGRYTVKNLQVFLNTMYIGREIYSKYLNL